MKNFRRFLAVIACFILVGTIFVNANVVNASVVKIASTKISLTVNQSKQIKINNKNNKATYTFKSSNSKIAAVSKIGKVKGIKTGEATITVKSILKNKVSRVGNVRVIVKAAPTSTPAPTSIPTPTSVPGIKVACVGDSITYGYGCPNDSYPKALQKLLGSDYIVNNYGMNSTTLLKNGNYSYWNLWGYNESTKWLPDIVIIMLGTNDAKPVNWKLKSEFLNDYKDLINHYKNLDSHPVVYVATCATVYADGNWEITDKVVTGEVVPLVKQAAEETGCEVIDVNTATQGMPKNFPDHIHGNKDGYQVIANTVYKAITANVPTTEPVAAN